MTSLSDLNTLVSADIRDSGHVVFGSTMVDSFVNSALSEVGRICPQRFIEQITPRTNALSYPLRCLLDVTGAASTDVFSCTAHGLDVGTQVFFRSLTGGAGLDTSTRYYVIASGLTADAFKLSTSAGSSSVDFTTDVTAATIERQDPLDGIEVRRVEVWDITATPNVYAGRLQPASAEYINQSDVGWDLWNGCLVLTNSQLSALVPGQHVIRVWGYSPYRYMNAYSNLTLSPEVQEAIRTYARLLALRVLVQDRSLFTQWQTATHNTDVSLASLMSDLNVAQLAWRQQSRSLMVLREVP